MTKVVTDQPCIKANCPGWDGDQQSQYSAVRHQGTSPDQPILQAKPYHHTPRGPGPPSCMSPRVTFPGQRGTTAVPRSRENPPAVPTSQSRTNPPPPPTPPSKPAIAPPAHPTLAPPRTPLHAHRLPFVRPCRTQRETPRRLNAARLAFPSPGGTRVIR